MTPNKTLITGATGFIGTRFCEKLTLHWKMPYRVIVRNYTNAARVARLDAEMVPGELANIDAISKALDGCDTLVHMAHGEDHKAPDETANVVRAALKAKVKRFVYISSMSVHGSEPGKNCEREETASLIYRDSSTYAVSKADEERVVQKAIDREGLPAIILRPTVVFGPHSGFVVDAVKMAQTGTMSLLDDGKWFCNAVYVDDVCSAIRAAMTCENGVGKAFFVNADKAATWADFNTTFGGMANPDAEIVNFESEELKAYWAAQQPNLKTNLASAAKLVVSPDLHREIGKVPMFKSAITWAKETTKGFMSPEKVVAFKSKVSPRPRASGGSSVPRPNEGRIRREVFPVEFKNDLAKATLDWKPAFTFKQGAEMTRLWLEFTRLIPQPK